MTGWTLPELDALLVAAQPPSTLRRAGQRPPSADGTRQVQPVPEDLPKPLRRLLGAEVPHRGRSSRFLSLVLLSIELGLQTEVIYAMLLSHEPSVRKYGSRLEAQVDALIDKHLHAGIDCIGAGCPHAPVGGGHSHEQVREQVGSMRAAAEQYPWPPRKRPTMLAVLNAHLDKAERLGRLEYDFDRRTMALAAGVARTTTDKRVRELLDAGWLLLVDEGAVSSHAFTYRLVGASVGPHHPRPGNSHQPAATQLCGPTSVSADIWRNGVGLGKTRRETWLALTGGARTVEALAKVTSRAPQTVRRHLVLFNQLGMAGPATQDAWQGEWEPYLVEWARLETYLGVIGYGDRQRERFAYESAAHRRYVNSGGGKWSSRPSREPRRR